MRAYEQLGSAVALLAFEDFKKLYVGYMKKGTTVSALHKGYAKVYLNEVIDWILSDDFTLYTGLEGKATLTDYAKKLEKETKDKKPGAKLLSEVLSEL